MGKFLVTTLTSISQFQLSRSNLCPNLFIVVSKQYFHMNVDCAFNLSRKYPQKLLDFDKGIIDLHKYHELPTLGSACIFDADSYKLINGFPNDLEGWGGEDWAIYNRIIKAHD